jgi:hypothetical protein
MGVAPDQETDVEPGKQESGNRANDGKNTGLDQADGEERNWCDQRQRQVGVRVRMDTGSAKLGLTPVPLLPEPAPEGTCPGRPLLQPESEGKDRQSTAGRG